jgi:hypothetical protein
MSLQRGRGGLVAAGVLSLLTALPAEAQPLRTNLDAWFLFAMQNANVKNEDLLGPCNVGVNCPHPPNNSECGVISHENSFYADGSQIAGDLAKFSKPGADIFQLFTNQLNGSPNIRQPPVQPLSVPIVGDLDMDGNPSCALQGGTCVPDYGDMEKFCGMPAPFPACDVLKPVLVLQGQDCLLATDTQLGNMRCDLGPGTYGNLTVQNGGTISFDGGTYQFCTVVYGKDTTTLAAAPAILNVSGDYKVNNAATFALDCGELSVNAKGPGDVSFGRNSSITGFFCAPERNVNLGHNNDLTGRFVGDVIRANSNNRGHCCGGNCTCFDAFSPTTVDPLDQVTLTSNCPLTLVSEVRVCGFVANVVSVTVDTLVLEVPAAAAGMSCSIEVDSAAGTFIHQQQLIVNP